MRPDTAAIIVAGGKGLRFGGRVRKQYLLLNRRPIVWWSLAAFEKSPSVRSLALVVPAEDVARVQRQARTWTFKKRLMIVAGGATRADSVREGMRTTPAECRYVAVHDAVRPLITPRLIEDVIRTARRYNAALAATPSKDTVKLANGDGFIHATPDRRHVWLAQTPQVFERRLLERAHAQGARRKATDDSQLVERLGIRVRLVESPAENLKITRPIDLVLARMILRA